MDASLPAEIGAAAGGTRWRWRLVIALVAAAAAYAIWPLRALVRGWNDFAFVYAAGRAWLKGLSPYDVAAWRAQWSVITPSFLSGTAPFPQPFIYPPHFAILAVPVALLPWPIAERLWDGLSVLSFAGIVALSWRLLPSRRRLAADPAWWALVALATVNASVRETLWECQMSMLPTLGIVGSFWALAEKKTAWLAVFAFLASLKPQIGLLPLLCIAANGGLAGVAIAGVAALVVAGVAMAPTPLALFPGQLANCFRLHQSIVFNAPDHLFSVSALWARYDPHRRLVLATPLLAIAFAAWLWRQRRTGPAELVAALDVPWKQAAIVLAATAALMPLHGYDLVLCSPLILFTYEMRPRWLAFPLVLLVQLVSRESLTARLPIWPIAPWLTLAIALCILAAVDKRLIPRSALR